MEKKIYSRPYAAEECFTPNQYVAACPVTPDFPVGRTGDHFYVDGLDNGGKDNCTRHTPDGMSGANEHISGMKSLAQVPGHHDMQWLENNYKNTWHVHQGYYDLTGQQNSEHVPYSDSWPFAPVVVLHLENPSNEWYYLAEGHVKTSNPWDYIPGSIKNQS